MVGFGLHRGEETEDGQVRRIASLEWQPEMAVGLTQAAPGPELWRWCKQMSTRLATVLLALAAGVGRGQPYVQDSVDVGGNV